MRDIKLVWVRNKIEKAIEYLWLYNKRTFVYSAYRHIRIYVLDLIMFPDFFVFKSLIILIYQKGEKTALSDFTKISLLILR